MDNILKIQQENTIVTTEPMDTLEFAEEIDEELSDEEEKSKNTKIKAENTVFDINTGNEIDLDDI